LIPVTGLLTLMFVCVYLIINLFNDNALTAQVIWTGDHGWYVKIYK